MNIFTKEYLFIRASMFEKRLHKKRDSQIANVLHFGTRHASGRYSTKCVGKHAIFQVRDKTAEPKRIKGGNGILGTRDEKGKPGVRVRAGTEGKGRLRGQREVVGPDATSLSGTSRKTPMGTEDKTRTPTFLLYQIIQRICLKTFTQTIRVNNTKAKVWANFKFFTNK